MSHREAPSCRIASLALIALLMCAGCSEQRIGDIIPVSDDIVVPGIGIKSCYVGMRVNELPGEWISGDPNSFASDYLSSPALSIGVVQRNAKVYTVSFPFSSKLKLFDEMKTPYHGKTEKGISSDSSIENVIHAYGRPTRISSVRGITGVGQAVGLAYFELGIYFQFDNGALIKISVQAPKLDYDPRWAEDIGDTTQYRAIGSDRSQ